MTIHDAALLTAPIIYYTRGLMRQLMPRSWAIKRRVALLSAANHHRDSAEIDARVVYYNKLSEKFDASQAPQISQIERGQSRYFLDLDEACTGFGPDRRLQYIFGDVTHIPVTPSVVKSRPISAGNCHIP